MFTMTQAGYQFLVGKMTGRKAVEHQIAFIEAFDAMASYLKNQREGLSYRCALKELEVKDSERRGSFHGRGLNHQIQILNFQEFIDVDGDRMTTTSLKVAVVHRKRHDNVLQVIRQRIKEAGDWGCLNFKETHYINTQNGQRYPMFIMTQDGYAFLVGKLGGKLAAQHHISYIKAFNAMTEYIANQRNGLRYQCAAKELEVKDSERRGSIHGRGLN